MSTGRAISDPPSSGRGLATRALVTVIGTFLALLVLELLLRGGAGAFLQVQRWQNRPGAAEASVVRVVCIGESTTAMGESPYPGQLEGLLNAGMPEREVWVFNAGIPGADTSIIVNRLDSILDKYSPHVVVAMMGANDHGGAIPSDDLPLADRRLFPDQLRIYRLARQLRHTAGQQQAESWRLGQRDGLMGEDEGPAPRVVRRAWSAEARGALERAESILRRACEADDVEVRTLLELGRFLARQARYEEAEPVYSMAIDRDPANATLHLEFSHLLKHTGDRPQSTRMIQRALELDPENAVAHLWMAHTFDDETACDRRREVLLLRAIELDPLLTRAYTALSDQFSRCSDRQRIPTLIEHGLAANPQDDMLQALYANYWVDQGEEDLAEERFARVNEIRAEYHCTMTRENYAHTLEILRRRGIRLVVVPYPMRSVEPLRWLVGEADDITFVDHEQPFRDAIRAHGYRGLFLDYCNGDSGHGTPTGNRVLAKAVAQVLLADDGWKE